MIIIILVKKKKPEKITATYIHPQRRWHRRNTCGAHKLYGNSRRLDAHT